MTRPSPPPRLPVDPDDDPDDGARPDGTGDPGAAVDGVLLNERFRVEHLPPAGLTLGSDLRSERPVAVLALPIRSSRAAAAAGLKPMLRAAAGLRSPGVARLRDAGQYDDRLVLVYDAGGASVAELLAEHGTLSPRDAAGITADVGEAVAAIRRAGLQPGSLDVRDLRLDAHGTLRVLPVPAVDRILEPVSAGSDEAGEPTEPTWGPAEQEADLQALQRLLGQLLGQPPAQLTSSAGTGDDAELRALVGISASCRSPRELRGALRSFAAQAGGAQQPAGLDTLASTGPLPALGSAPTGPLPVTGTTAEGTDRPAPQGRPAGGGRRTGSTSSAPSSSGSGPRRPTGGSGSWRESWSATMLLSVLVAAVVLVTGFVVTAR